MIRVRQRTRDLLIAPSLKFLSPAWLGI